LQKLIKMTQTNHFDNIAREWDKNEMHQKRTEAIAEYLLQMIPANKKLNALEFGAGTGLLSIALKDHFTEITLMDSSAEMIYSTIEKLMQKGITHLKPIFFDLEKQAYTDKTFDVIFCQMVMHHVGNIAKMVLKFSKLLNPGGLLAIADLYTEDGTFHDIDFDGHFGFDPAALAEIMNLNGFCNVNCLQCFVIEKTKEDGNTKNYPVFLLTAEKN
jgi:tRNA (cmo5U34)-methyltransferase